MDDHSASKSSARGTLRVYLGAAPGVGKTYAMLNEGTRRHARGTDVVVGLVETHGRANTAEQIGDLEVIPRRTLNYRGRHFTEMDVDAVLARRPGVALVDELAHSNIPGSRNAKRWQDVDELLDAGIDVISTVNIQHLESLNDVVEQITGTRQGETIPDHVVRAADQIELVDMAPEALRRRMAHGNIYPADRVDASLANYFRVGNLSALRELALLWVADRVDEGLHDYMAAHGIAGPWETKERIVVALTGAPGSADLIRRAARMASRTRTDLIGVHVRTDDGLVEGPQDRLAEHRQLLLDLGATYREIVGTDIAATLVRFARAEQATQIVIGASGRSRASELFRGSIINSVLRAGNGLDVHVIDTRGEQPVGPALTLAQRHLTLTPRRLLTGWLVAIAGIPLVTLVLAHLRHHVSLPGDLMVYLLVVVAAAAIGGLGPAIFSAVTGSLAANWFFTPPRHTLTISENGNIIALVVFVIVGLVVATLVTRANSRRTEALRAQAEAESMAWAIAEVASEGDPVPGLLHLLRTTLALDGVAVLVEPPDGGAMMLEASDGDDPPLTVEAADVTVALSDGAVLAVRGTLDKIGDPRVLHAIAAQVASARKRKVLETEAARAAAVAQTNELRTALLRAVSHDLRTPIASIKASVTSLLQSDVTWSPDDVDGFLGAIDEETDRLDHIIVNLLDMSRLEAGAIAPKSQPVDPEELVAVALRSLSGNADRIRIDVASSLPALVTDAGLVERALANVTDNALAYTPASTPVRVEVSKVGSEVHFRVVDRGPGLPREDRSKLFEPFRRLDDRHNRSGVGLGLAVAHGFIEAVGGTITLDDTPAGGLTVDIAVPVVPSGEPEPASPDETVAHETRATDVVADRAVTRE